MNTKAHALLLLHGEHANVLGEMNHFKCSEQIFNKNILYCNTLELHHSKIQYATPLINITIFEGKLSCIIRVVLNLSLQYNVMHVLYIYITFWLIKSLAFNQSFLPVTTYLDNSAV